MACLSLSCNECDWERFSNRQIYICPECGGSVFAEFDEPRESEIEEIETEGEDLDLKEE